jgi:hypothetical protein
VIRSKNKVKSECFYTYVSPEDQNNEANDGDNKEHIDREGNTTGWYTVYLVWKIGLEVH